MHNYQQHRWLTEHYVQQELTAKQCAALAIPPVCVTTIYDHLRKNGIATRPHHSPMKGERNPFVGKEQSVETRQKISKAKVGYTRSLESRRKQSRSITGANNHRYGKPRGHGQGSWVVLLDNRIVYMRSSWEVYFADWLSQHKKEWEYEPQAFPLPDGSIYTPDFLSGGIFYEIKGWYNEAEKAKIATFRRAYPNISLQIIDKEVFNTLGIDTQQKKLSYLTLTGPRTRICPTCNSTFIPERKTTQFCSNRCHAKSPRKPLTWLVCEVCDKKVKVYPSQLKYRHTCSISCGRIANAKKRKGSHYQKKHRETG